MEQHRHDRERLARRARAGLRDLIRLLGHDPDAADLADTPDRVLTALQLLAARPDDAAGVAQALGELPAKLGSGHRDCHVGPVPFTAICHQHLIPFAGGVYLTHAAGTGRPLLPVQLEWLVAFQAAGLTSPADIAARAVAALQREVGGDGAACLVRVTRRCPVMHDYDGDALAGWGCHTIASPAAAPSPRLRDFLARCYETG
jgi:GTP cyclohydrolase I